MTRKSSKITVEGRFAQEVVSWVVNSYPDRRIRTLVVELDGGDEVRVPVAATAFPSSLATPDTLSDADKAILGFLEHMRAQGGGAMTAPDIREAMEKEDWGIYGLSTVEKSLVKMRASGLIDRKKGEGYCALVVE